MKKTCSQCGESKKLTEFSPNGECRIKAACKSCRSISNQLRYHANNSKMYVGVTGALYDNKGKQVVPGSPVRVADQVKSKSSTTKIPSTPTDLLSEHKKDIELRKLRKEHQSLIEALDIAQKRGSILDDLSNLDAPPITRREVKSGLREATAVVMCSDWHVEEPVEPEKVNGMNEYNLEIADQRINRLIDGSLWLLDMHRSKFKIRDMILWLGGDFFSGYIHEELEESNLLSPVESILWLQVRLTAMIDAFLADGTIESLVVPCSYGNHGRTGKKKRISTGAENSYEWLMYQQLAQWYKNDPRVTIIAPKGQMIYLDVYDFKIRTIHGDQVGYGGGVGGISVPINKKLMSWDIGQPADVTLLGHFHRLTNNERFVVNGSLIGQTPFAIYIGAGYEPPRQSFFLMDSERGKTASYPLWVD